MRHRGLSNLALAKDLGIAHTTVGDWREDARPRAAMIRKLADYFGIPVELLLDDSKELPHQYRLGLETAALAAEIGPEKKWGSLTKEERGLLTAAVVKENPQVQHLIAELTKLTPALERALEIIRLIQVPTSFVLHSEEQISKRHEK